jgi:hypothetical protein
MDDEGPSPNSGAARLIVLLCAVGLGTIGAFTAFFATEILSAVLKSATRPTTGVLILCALVPVGSAVVASAIAVRSSGTGKVLGLGCSVLVLGALATLIVMFAAAL